MSHYCVSDCDSELTDFEEFSVAVEEPKTVALVEEKCLPKKEVPEEKDTTVLLEWGFLVSSHEDMDRIQNFMSIFECDLETFFGCRSSDEIKERILYEIQRMAKMCRSDDAYTVVEFMNALDGTIGDMNNEVMKTWNAHRELDSPCVKDVLIHKVQDLLNSLTIENPKGIGNSNFRVVNHMILRVSR